MTTVPAVYWHQGMFMLPQHLQLADLRHETQLAAQLDALSAHHWGVGELNVDRWQLQQRTLAISAATLRFGDGTLITMPGDAIVEVRQLDLADFEEGRPVVVYAALRSLDWQGHNVSQVSGADAVAGTTTRFVACEPSVETPDLYAEAAPAAVIGLQYFVRLLIGDEVETAGPYQRIPLLRLRRTGDAIAFDDDYVPPCYRLRASPTLSEQIASLAHLLATRARRIGDYQRQDWLTADAAASDGTRLLALVTLNRCAAELAALYETPQMHPERVYTALRKAVAELSAFSSRFDLFGQLDPELGADPGPGVGPYLHEGLDRCFGQAGSVIAALLDDLAVEPKQMIPMLAENGGWQAALPESMLGRQQRVYLAVSGLGDDATPQLKRLQRDALLAAPGQLQALRAHALPGLELMPAATTPSGLPYRRGLHYLRIEQVSEEWDHVVAARSLGLRWDEAPSGIQLFVAALGK